jgi:hypothetical protein
MKFALVAYLLMSGQPHSYMLDTGLTYDDCNQAVAARALPRDLPNDLRRNLAHAPVVCELER